MDHPEIVDVLPNEVLERQNYRISENFRWLGSVSRDTQDLYLTVAGTERCRPDKSYGPIARRDYHVHVVLHGKGYLEMNGRTWPVQRGQIFTTIPGQEVLYRAEPTDPWYYAWLSFSGNRAAELMEKAGFTAEHPVRSCGADPEQYLASVEKILNHHQLTLPNEMIRTIGLHEFILLLLTTRDTRNAPRVSDYPPDVYAQAALEYIEHNYATITVADLADHIGVSRT